SASSNGAAAICASTWRRRASRGRRTSPAPPAAAVRSASGNGSDRGDARPSPGLHHGKYRGRASQVLEGVAADESVERENGRIGGLERLRQRVQRERREEMPRPVVASPLDQDREDERERSELHADVGTEVADAGAFGRVPVQNAGCSRGEQRQEQ